MTPSAFEQGFAGSIQIQGDVVRVQKSGDTDIGCMSVNGRSGAGKTPETVHNTVLDAQGGEVQTFQWGTDCGDIDTDRVFHTEPCFPWLFDSQTVYVFLMAMG